MKVLQDHIIEFPLFQISDRHEEIPVIRDRHTLEPTHILVIREPEGVPVESLEGFDGIRQWVAAMRKKYNVINL